MPLLGQDDLLELLGSDHLVIPALHVIVQCLFTGRLLPQICEGGLLWFQLMNRVVLGAHQARNLIASSIFIHEQGKLHLATRVANRQIVIDNVQRRRRPLGKDNSLAMATPSFWNELDCRHFFACIADLLELDLIWVDNACIKLLLTIFSVLRLHHDFLDNEGLYLSLIIKY